MRPRRVLSSLFVLAAITSQPSCITHKPTRTFDELNRLSMPSYCANTTGFEDTSIRRLQERTPAGEGERTRVSCVAEERHEALAATTETLEHERFDLHVLEFDDDGVAWNPERQADSFKALQERLKEPAVVVAFVHGWKNDASVCNGNIACFREVLQILAKGEKLYSGWRTPRRVIGVYIGWRGGTVKPKGLNAFSFWGRKHTAHVVGDNGGVTAVIERLRTLVQTARAKSTPATRAAKQAPAEMTSLIFVGHSFGGALLYSALATSLNASVGAAVQSTALAEEAAAAGLAPRAASEPGRCPELPRLAAQEQYGRAAQRETLRPVISAQPACVETTGDLVILINPAMEASRFANLAYTRNLQFVPEQVPIFMTLASEADWAVGGFFPVGQAFATLSRAARSRDGWFRMEKGFGLYEPYHTHRLVAMPRADVPKPTGSSAPCRCSSNLKSVGDALLNRLKPFYDEIRKLDQGTPPDPRVLQLAGYREMLFSRLEPVRDVDPNNPFVMATVDPGVVNGHSDIFNTRFMDFLIEYIISAELKRGFYQAYRREEGAR